MKKLSIITALLAASLQTFAQYHSLDMPQTSPKVTETQR